jgi:G6PDH family F420-dependent oxidoreductase
MVNVGYTLMTEQAGPKDLVRWAARAEDAGFDLLVSSDHYFPWLDEQGHAPSAWVMLGAVAQATGRAELMTYVTCPTMRYHPAVVAQQAATLALLSDSRFTLGLGAGENLNEHVIGKGWPDADQRQDMLAEAVRIIRALLDGGYVNFRGSHFRVDAARIWDLPDRPVPLGVAVSGRQSCELFAPLADVMIAVEPDGSLAGWWDAACDAGQSARKVGQMPICWGQRGTAGDGGLRRRHRFRPARGRSRLDSLRRFRGRGGRGGGSVLQSRIYRLRAGPDRRHRAGAGPLLRGRTGTHHRSEGNRGLAVSSLRQGIRGAF